MVANKFYPVILQLIALRPETREWFLEEVTGNEGYITIDTRLIDLMIFKGMDPQLQNFIEGVAKVIGYDVSVRQKSKAQEMKERYGHKCQYCGGIFDEHELVIDEIVPQSKGGKKIERNQVPACETCNGKKGGKNVFVFMREEGFTLTTGLKDKLDGLVQKGDISYPKGYPLLKKKRKKERLYSYEQVMKIHNDASNPLQQKDFKITDEDDPNSTTGKKLWRLKK